MSNRAGRRCEMNAADDAICCSQVDAIQMRLLQCDMLGLCQLTQHYSSHCMNVCIYTHSYSEEGSVLDEPVKVTPMATDVVSDRRHCRTLHRLVVHTLNHSQHGSDSKHRWMVHMSSTILKGKQQILEHGARL